MARYVLVHGAFAGGWCWEPVVTELQRRGHDVVAPDLPGSGSDGTPVEQVTLDAYADRIGAVLAEQPEPVVLVGHSMGGVVITQAASRYPDNVRRLVYVAAFLPGDGDSLKALTELPEGQGDGVQDNMTVAGDPPVATLTPEAARDIFLHCCDEEQAAWAMGRFGPQPVVPFLTPVSLSPAVGAIPRCYVYCTEDRSLLPALQKRMFTERPCADVLGLPVDHSPYLSATTELVDGLEHWGR
jgi:pimeloyl-ACP methyl ester carboxylesterase